MSKQPADCFEEQHNNSSNCKGSSPTTEPIETTEPQSKTVVTPAEYIYNSMIPPTKMSSETVEVADLGVSLGKRERCNTGGSSKSGGGPIMSMDLSLRPEDIELDGGLSAFGIGIDDEMVRLKSSDVVKDLLLPDTAATAAAALGPMKESQPSASDANNEQQKQRLSQKEIPDNFCPIVNLTARLERISTGEEIAPLSENFRLSSSDWVKDFKDEDPNNNLGPMHPSLFMDSNSSNPGVSSEQHSSISPLPFNPSGDIHDNEYQVSLKSPGDQSASTMPPIPPLSSPTIVHNLPPLTSSNNSNKLPSTSPSSSTTSKKKRRKRMIGDRPIEPTENDVLFGRGGYTNTHKGNIKFRERALELRPWYEQPGTSKEEKYRISDLLVESVKSEGHRFLEKGEDGLWYEVIGNGARKKASQALRERLKGSRRTAGGNASSLTSTKSAGSASAGGGHVNVDEIIGDIMPASVNSDDVVGV